MGPGTPRARVCVLGVLLALLWGRPAAADDLEAARAHFQRAEEHYVAARYEEAFGEYEAAFAASPLPDFLFNMGQCQRKLGQRDRAIEYYRRFLETGPPPDRRAITEEIIAELENQAPPVVAPPPQPRPAPPRAVAPPPAPAPHATGGGIRWPTWVALGGGVALLGVGGFFAIEAAGAQSDLDEASCSAELSRCFEIKDDGSRSFLLRNVFLVAGAAVVGLSAVLVVLDLSARPPGRDDELTVRLSPGGLSVGGTW